MHVVQSTALLSGHSGWKVLLPGVVVDHTNQRSSFSFGVLNLVPGENLSLIADNIIISAISRTGC